MRHLLIIITSIVLISSIQAQNTENSVTIGIDPLVIGVLGGFEVEAGYNFGKNRVAFEYLGAELPAVWNSQIDDFEEVSANIYELSYSRFLKEGQKGFHYGIAFSLFSNFEVEMETGQTLSKDISKLGIRLGYMWFPFKKANFFVEPLFNLGIYLDDEDLDFGNNVIFDKKTFAGSGPVIHLGYKFTF